ncbi:MAG: hypothetical protein ACRCYE_06590 [Sarcina sp.]
MQLISYGLGIIEKEKFIKPIKVDKYVNKITGGLWCCEENELYSEWVVLTMLAPFLVKSQIPYLSTIHLKDDINIAYVNKDNYLDFMDGEALDLDVFKNIDVIKFDDNLEQIELFESYYFECYQILNFECIKSIEVSKLDVNKILSDDYSNKAHDLINDKILKRLYKTKVFKIVEEELGE